jgi:GMP synthase (glutamine-hydrolysing)
VTDICGAKTTWTPKSIIDDAVERIQKQVGGERVLAAVSGGVDSSVASALVHKAIGDQLVAVFVDTGLLRKNEGEQVASAFRDNLHAELVTVDASDEFFSALHGVTEPEQKRKVVGEKFIRIFEAQAKQLGQPGFLVQGTIYPDVVESSAPDRNKAEKIKTHHNVGGLPRRHGISIGRAASLPVQGRGAGGGRSARVAGKTGMRQPFPGPGLTVRCLGEVTAGARVPFAGGRRHPDRGIVQSRLFGSAFFQQFNCWKNTSFAGVRRVAARTLSGRDGRPAHVSGGGGDPRGDDRGFHDRRLGAPAA